MKKGREILIILNLHRLGKVRISTPTRLELVALTLILTFIVILVVTWQ